MKRKISLLVVLFLLVKISSAQYEVPSQKHALEAKKRTLLVQLRYISDPDLKKLFKGDAKEMKDYRLKLDGFNALLQDAIKKYWTLNTDIEYKTSDDIKAVLKKDEDKYVVLRSHWGERIVHGIHDMKFEVYEFGLYLGSKDKALFAMAYADDKMSAFDMRFIVRQFNKYVEAGCRDLSVKDTSIYSVDKNLEVLKKKTLYLPKEGIDIEEKDIKAEYPFAYRVVTTEELNDTIKAGRQDIVFPSFVWSERKNMYMYILVDAATYDVLSVTGMGGVFMDVVGGNTGPNPYFKSYQEPLFSIHTGIAIGKKQLKYWVKPFEMKFNY